MFDSNQRINREIPIPLYYQLQNIILDMINSGELQPGYYIPTESELGQMYQLSRTTVRQAIMGLVMEGKLHRVKGKGTFVAKPKIVQDFMRKLEPFSAQIGRLGLVPSTKVLDMSCVEAPQEVTEVFGSKEPVIRLNRLRYADFEPIVVLSTYLPMTCKDILHQDMERLGLYEFLSRDERTRVCIATRQIEAVAAGKYESELLHIDFGSPIQMTTTIGRSANNEPIEYSVAKYRGDKNKFVVELSL